MAPAVGINIDIPPAGRRGSIEIEEVVVLLDLPVPVPVVVPVPVCVPVFLAVPVPVSVPLLESVELESFAVLVCEVESVLLALESVVVWSDAVVSIESAANKRAIFHKLTSSGRNLPVCHIQSVRRPWPS